MKRKFMDVIKNFQIINGDNSWVLLLLPSESVSLIIASPPYGTVRSYNSWIDLPVLAKEFYRVLKPGGILCWNEGDTVVKGSKTAEPFKHAIYFKDHDFTFHDHIIYQKDSFGFPSAPCHKRYHNVFEHVFVFSKGKIQTFNGIEDRRNKHAGEVAFDRGSEWQKGGTQKKRTKKNGKVIEEFGLRHNVWFYSVGGGKTCTDGTKFQALMPEALAADLIKTYSNLDDLVLDPFAGGGTTLKMARLLGRKCIGIEIADEYCKLIENRVNGLKTITAEELKERLLRSASAHLN